MQRLRSANLITPRMDVQADALAGLGQLRHLWLLAGRIAYSRWGGGLACRVSRAAPWCAKLGFRGGCGKFGLASASLRGPPVVCCFFLLPLLLFSTLKYCPPTCPSAQLPTCPPTCCRRPIGPQEAAGLLTDPTGYVGQHWLPTGLTSLCFARALL